MGVLRRCTRRKSVDDDDKSVVRLRREFGVLRGVAIIAGSVIGTGIFISPKGVLLHSGSIGASLCVWVACGAFSALGALSYAEIGVTIPKSGGTFTYVHEAFGPAVSFLFIWTDLVLRRSTSQSIAALAVVKYMLTPFFGSCPMPSVAVKLFAVAVLALLGAVNAWSVRWTAHLQNMMFYVKGTLLILIITLGIVHLTRPSGAESFQDLFQDTTTSAGEFGLAMYNGLYAYAGWEVLNYASEEVKNQRKTLPLAIYISITFVTVVYTLANVAYFAVMGKEGMLSSQAVAATFAEMTIGSSVSWMVPVAVMCSIIGSLNYNVCGSSRVYFVSARDGGHLPSIFGMINVDRLTPLPALILNCTASAIVLVLFRDNIYMLLNYYSFFRWIMGGSGVAALIWLRFRQPDLPRPIKYPIAIHIVFLLICMTLVIIPVYRQPLNSFIAICLMLSGLPVYFLLVRNRNKPTWYYYILGRVTVVLQKILKSCPQDKGTYTSTLTRKT